MVQHVQTERECQLYGNKNKENIALQKGEIRTEFLENGKLLALQWKDKRLITMLSSIHDSSMVTKTRRTRASASGRENIQKPFMVDQYNTYMGGVDKSDQYLSYYGFDHRMVKWYKRAVFHLLDLAIVNAYIMYKLSVQSGKHMSHVQFRIKLATELLTRSGIVLNSSCSGSHDIPLPPNARLQERHFIEKIPQRPNGKPSQHECVVCSFKKGNGRKTSTYQCKQCMVTLCVVPCFELYHTRVDPTRYL